MASPSNPSTAQSNPPLKSTDQEKIRRLVLLGASTRELAETFNISISNANRYRIRWQQELQAVRQDERELARALILDQHRKAEEMYTLAKSRTRMVTDPAAIAQPGQKRSELPKISIPWPDFAAMEASLVRMDACSQKLGEFSRSIGTTGVAQIRAQSEENIESMKQEFAIDHPDRIPGLGFGQTGPGPFGLHGQGNGHPGVQVVMVMPKSVEGERLERQRLGLPELEG